MTEQNNGDKSSNSATKQKKPTSAYKKFRRKFAGTVLRTPLIWWRHRGLEPSDMIFAAYPKSGTTWARFVLFEMLSGMPSGFRATNQQMPGMGLHKHALRLLPNGGRLIATHEYYRDAYKRTIYMVRDARDVLLSEFAFLSALEYYTKDLDHFVKTFLFTRVSAYGPWHKNVASYLDSPIAKNGNMLLVRYEDLRKDPVPLFAQMADFLGVKINEDKIKQAVANNSIQKMRDKEDKEPVRASIGGRFVRDGKVRGWVSKLAPAQLQLIEEHAGSTLLRLGYPLSSQLVTEESPIAETTVNA
ncbi:MAG TPA: sulfotransferase domain-containing protein [Candidatus Eisenbacteria bacterium]|nr:sulfotransferase domain-containing protein [Candidatus Eisenbacteria bacterium]